MAIVFLDSGMIGLITSPRKQGQALACEQWMLGLLARGVNIVSSIKHISRFAIAEEWQNIRM